MILKTARIRNFRCLRDVTIEFDRQTVLLGGNGSGKSTVLRALNLFYDAKAHPTGEDFFNRGQTEPIEIDLTFTSLNKEEMALFSSRVVAGELSVARVFDPTNTRISGRYFGTSSQAPAFADIRKVERAVERRQAYNALRQRDARFGDLPTVTNDAALQTELENWEQNHPNDCLRIRDDGQFFGYANIANGKLRRATEFVFIPAVRDASADARDTRGAAMAQLMELVVRNALDQRPELRKFREEASAEYRNLMNPKKLTELSTLGGMLTAALKEFYADAAVDLQWEQIADLVIPVPTALVSLLDNDYRAPVELSGHGLQRAFIFALLQHLAFAASVDRGQSDEAAASETEDGAGATDGIAPATPTVSIVPGLILAIEEPELYQHPTKQRHFANVLTRLSEGTLPGAARHTQVIFATHSPLFVRLDRFSQLRLARKIRAGDAEPRQTAIRASDLHAIAKLLEIAHAKPKGSFSGDTLLPRLHIVGPEICEGFFANLVVLVEGPSDRAALIGAAKLGSVDFESLGIAVLPCGSKSNMDRPAAIFSTLGIPLYLVWDSDGGTGDEQKKRNVALRRLMGVNTPVASEIEFVAHNHACFGENLEQTLRAEIGDQKLNDLLAAECARWGMDERKEVTKVPDAMAGVLSAAAVSGSTSPTLRRIIDAIVTLLDTEAALAQQMEGGREAGEQA